MTRIFHIVILILVAVAGAAVSYAADKKTPAVRFEETVHDFGNIKSSEQTLEHTFQFTNTGDAPLVIVPVSASCGCTKPEFDPKPIAPGDSSEIKIRLTTRGIKGEFDKRATVRTNIKGKDRKVLLTLKGLVIPSAD